MSENTTAAAVPYFWLITLQVPSRQGYMVATRSGVFTAAAGTTRQDAYQQITAHLIRQDPDLKAANVLFFSLEPNDLTA